ncbi:MAG: hypothetical protein OJF51_000117 [Nitrospira sp.]|jgi:hypothetical protein|nr:MAG: hypothetical protein OJF51_000117 [Nitrospira sp.]
MSATPNRAAITSFVEMIHTRAKAAEVEGELVLVAYGQNPSSGKKLPSRIKPFPIGDVSRMVEQTMEWTVLPHVNVYTALVLMRPNLPIGSRGGKEDIVAVLGLVADYDDANAVDWPNRVPLAPSYALESSPGRFQTGYFLDPSDAAHAETLAKRLQLTAKCDAGTGDIAHVWRIDGTLNWPNAKKAKAGRSLEPVLVRAVPGGTGAIVNGLESVLVPLEETKKTEKPSEPIPEDDETQLARAFGSKNGTKIKKLWAGDWIGDYPSQSEADSALCCYLAYWYGRNPERMDRMFRQSKLMREKWDERRNESTYGAECIANACATVTETYQAPLTVAERLAKLRALSIDDLKATWKDYVRGLNAEDRHTVLTELARLLGTGVNLLKARLREEHEQKKREAAQQRIGRRTIIEFRPEDVCDVAHQVEAAMVARLTEGECVRFGDSVVRFCRQTLPHTHQADSDVSSVPTGQLDLMTRAKLLPLVERATVLQIFTESGSTLIGVPHSILDQILVNPRFIRTVIGLSAHPQVIRTGEIIAASGIDPTTGLFLYGPHIEGLRPYSQAEAREAVDHIVRDLFDGFEFASGLDIAAALALLFTIVERKLMDMSPGFLITASTQSSGKTSLARKIHCAVTGTDAPIFTWPDDDVEVQKLLLSTLLRSPEVVTFDNCGDGMSFRSPALSAAMTSATKQGRLLGHNRDAVVSTSVVFILTGNNVTLSNDEASRFIPIRLTTKEVSPHKRQFTYPDLIRHALEIRDVVLRHVIGVIAGYLTHNEPVQVAPSRFPQWDRLVRHPLLWSGQEDVGTVFDMNIETSPELGAHRALLHHLRHLYDGKQFSASDLVTDANPRRAAEGSEQWFGPDPILRETLLALRVKDIKSERSVGHALSRLLGRNAVNEWGVVLYLDRTMKNGLARYEVKRREKEVGSL